MSGMYLDWLNSPNRGLKLTDREPLGEISPTCVFHAHSPQNARCDLETSGQQSVCRKNGKLPTRLGVETCVVLGACDEVGAGEH